MKQGVQIHPWTHVLRTFNDEYPTKRPENACLSLKSDSMIHMQKYLMFRCDCPVSTSQKHVM